MIYEDYEFIDVDVAYSDEKCIVFVERGGGTHGMWNLPDTLENIIEVDENTSVEEIKEIILKNEKKVTVKKGDFYYAVVYDFLEILVKVPEDVFKKAKEVRGTPTL